jgi:mono/diheme cytochrome c family protein
MEPAELLDQLRSPERWTRYQAKRLLFDAPEAEVLAAADAWLARLAPASTPNDERLLLEVTGVFEAHEAVRPDLLAKLLAAEDPRVRAYGARVAGMWADRLPDALALLREGVRDDHPRVRLEAVVAASYVSRAEAVEVAAAAIDQPRDPFLDYAIRQSARALQPHWGPALQASTLTLGSAAQETYLKELLGTLPKQPSAGEALYEMACLTCHQPGGRGLPGVYPPLAGSEWLRGEKQALIKIVLHGLTGPVTVAGQSFGGGPASVPMPAMGGLTDSQIADVLTFVRGAYGQGAPPVTADDVQSIRAATADRTAPWTALELGR